VILFFLFMKAAKVRFAGGDDPGGHTLPVEVGLLEPGRIVRVGRFQQHGVDHAAAMTAKFQRSVVDDMGYGAIAQGQAA
jgi:hypothetical protein